MQTCVERHLGTCFSVRSTRMQDTFWSKKTEASLKKKNLSSIENFNKKIFNID